MPLLAWQLALPLLRWRLQCILVLRLLLLPATIVSQLSLRLRCHSGWSLAWVVALLLVCQLALPLWRWWQRCPRVLLPPLSPATIVCQLLLRPRCRSG